MLILEDRDFRPAFVFDDVDELRMEGIDLPAERDSQIVFEQVTNMSLNEKATKQVRELD